MKYLLMVFTFIYSNSLLARNFDSLDKCMNKVKNDYKKASIFRLRKDVKASECFDQFKDRLSVNSCYKASKYLFDNHVLADAYDLERSCFEFFKDKISFEECLESTKHIKADRVSILVNKCLKHFEQKISATQCFTAADYIFMTDDIIALRMNCMADYRNSLSWEKCVFEADNFLRFPLPSMARKKCYEFFKNQITKQQCIDNANQMMAKSYKDDMLKLCENIGSYSYDLSPIVLDSSRRHVEDPSVPASPTPESSSQRNESIPQ